MGGGPGHFNLKKRPTTNVDSTVKDMRASNVDELLTIPSKIRHAIHTHSQLVDQRVKDVIPNDY